MVAETMKGEPTLEAVKIDRVARTISVATLGRTTSADLEKNLTARISQIQDNAEGGKAKKVLRLVTILILLCTMVAYVVMNYWQRFLPAAEAGLIYCAEPVSASLFALFLPALALYLFVLPRVYGFSALGHPLQLMALASVFVLATSFLGQAVGAWFKHPETPTLIFLGTSLPQFFLAGFSWPREAIPERVMKFKAKDGVFQIEGSLIAISTDGGQNWTFVDSTGKDQTELKKIIPNLDKLKLPPEKEPVKVTN
jgi:hypothetical protein